MLPRKQLPELVALYELEPDIRDVFAEGPFDVAIIKWFLNQKGMTNVMVYDISTVEIPDDELRQKGRMANNYERVVFLAEHAESFLLPNQKQITCVVDRDFSHFLKEERLIESLLYTEYSCMEMYLFNKTTLTKIFTIYCNKPDWPIDEIILTLSNVLQEFYLFRLANQILGWQMSFLDKFSCMNVVGWGINFDQEEFLKRYLNKNGRMSVKGVFLSTLNSYRLKLDNDFRHQIHGHDFVETLCWYLRKKGVSKDSANSKIFGRVLAVALSSEQLEETHLFKCLAKRVTNI